MPFCPTCGAEYQPGVARCSDCDVPLTDAPPAPEYPAVASDTPWVDVYTGQGVLAEALESLLNTAGITTVKAVNRLMPSVPQISSPTIGQALAWLTLSVPEDQYTARRGEIEAAVAEVTGGAAANAEAVAEAEEDYDVRGCPTCVLYFHENFSACPGCGTALLPAVEIFAEGQAEPDRVIVAAGDESAMKALAGRYAAAGFGAQAVAVDGWAVAAVDLSWAELTGRTAEAEAILAAPAS